MHFGNAYYTENLKTSYYKEYNATQKYQSSVTLSNFYPKEFLYKNQQQKQEASTASGTYS